MGAMARNCQAHQRTRGGSKACGAVRRSAHHSIGFLAQACGVMANFGAKIGGNPFYQAHAHQKIGGVLEKTCHVHSAAGSSLLAL